MLSVWEESLEGDGGGRMLYEEKVLECFNQTLKF